MVRIKKITKIFNKIKSMSKSVLNFILPKEELRNIEGIYQLLLVFGLLIISVRFMGLHNVFDIIKNGLAFICLFIIMISDKILTMISKKILTKGR